MEMVRWYSPGKPDHLQRSPQELRYGGDCAPHCSIHFNFIYPVSVTVGSVSRHRTRSQTLTPGQQQWRQEKSPLLTGRHQEQDQAPMEGLGANHRLRQNMVNIWIIWLRVVILKTWNSNRGGSVWQEVGDAERITDFKISQRRRFWA